MTKDDYLQIERALEKTLRRVKKDKEYSKTLLNKTGIYKKDGSLSEHFNSTTPSSVCIK